MTNRKRNVRVRLWVGALALASVLGAAPAVADATCDRLFARLRIAGTPLGGTAAIQAAFPQTVHTSWTTSYYVPASNTRFTGLTSLNLTMAGGDLVGSGIRTITAVSGIPPSGSEQVSLRIRADGRVMFNNQHGPYDPRCPLPVQSPVRNPNDVFAVVESGDSIEAFNFKPAGIVPATWLAHLPVDGMTLAGNGVFFTTHETTGSRIYGIGQSAVNGQQSALYGETGTARFGDIVVSTVGGKLFGYFWTQDGAGARLKRVHLADPNQPVTTLVGPVNSLDIVASRRNLATDGEALYWQEARRVRKLFLSGGAPVDLAQTSAAPRAGVHLRGTTLFFGDGNAVKSVSVMGGVVSTVATAPNSATVLSILPLPNSFIYSDATGAIAGPSAALRPSGPSNATSLAHDGGRLATTQCTSANVCSVWVQNFPAPGNDAPLAAGPNAHFLMSGPAGKLFWGDETGLRRFP